MTNDNLIIKFPSNEREKIKYKIIKIRTVDVDGGYGQYPAICTVEIETGILLHVTKLEFYLNELMRKGKRMSTIEGAAKIIVRLMNYILHEETINGIHEIDAAILKRYEEHLKTKVIGQSDSLEEQISIDSWYKYLRQTYYFLEKYYEKNHEKARFHYHPNELRQEKIYNRTNDGIPVKMQEISGYTTPPKQKAKKYRYLPKTYLELLQEEYKLHKPDLYLAIELQRSAGLREGDVVNISRNRIHVPTGAGDITIDLRQRAAHTRKSKNKSETGAIKKYREQKVYPAFYKEVKEAYKKHLLLEEQKFKRLGKEIDPNGPLFTNDYGNPLTTPTYYKKCRNLFFDHFVPDLEAYCIATEQYDVNKALIDAYKSNFIGCHSLRHWFTMYLKVTEGLDDVQVAAWRGDSNMKSYYDYIHKNHEILENYEKVAFRFQSEMLMAIKDGRARRFMERGADDSK